MGWFCSQKLTHSPHPDKPSHYLLWPLLVFELTPPLLGKKLNRAEHRTAMKIYKLNTDGTPRISTNLDGIVVGIDPENLKLFIDDILCCFNENLKGYLE